jgi:hypothetical protein
MMLGISNLCWNGNRCSHALVLVRIINLLMHSRLKRAVFTITALDIPFVIHSSVYQFNLQTAFYLHFLHSSFLYVTLDIVSTRYLHTLFPTAFHIKCPTLSFVHSSDVVLTASATAEVRHTFILIISLRCTYYSFCIL